MYRLLILILVFFSVIPTFANTRTYTVRHPYYNRYHNPNYHVTQNNNTMTNSFPYSYYGGDYIPQKHRYSNKYKSRFYDINDLEKYAMNKNYHRENDRTRIERLEMLAFGAVQTGDIDTRYENVRNAILTRPKQNYKTSVLKTISNYFGGQITGFTPSDIDSYSYGNSSVIDYASPFGKGTKIDNYGLSSGTGIKILD